MKDDYAKQRRNNDDDLILRFFLCIPASAAAAAAVNPRGIKTLLANGLITFVIKGNPVFSNGPSNLPYLMIILKVALHLSRCIVSFLY